MKTVNTGCFGAGLDFGGLYSHFLGQCGSCVCSVSIHFSVEIKAM